MESLRVLSLTGNSVISKIKNYRKTLTIKCVSYKAMLNTKQYIISFYLFVVVDSLVAQLILFMFLSFTKSSGEYYTKVEK